MIDECSTNRIEAALCGRLSTADEAELHEHLSHCDFCNAAMEVLVGGHVFCDQTASYLTDDPLDEDVPKREEWSAVDFSVEQLDPSEDPSLLGRIGGYDVLEIIGQGGMGIVLKGFDPELKRYVAIKALSPHLGNSSLARKRFAREAQAAAAVVNPHVIAIHQVQPNGRLPFLVMPLLGGESLAQRLQSRGRLELTEVLRIGMQAAVGLAAAHEQGLVHRDVKPANILLEKGVERAVLTDFGLARAADDMSMTRWGVIAGTPQYMSPEQARGENLDGRSDLFSLGCVLYEMASGVSPFKSSSTVAALRRVVDEKPQSLTSLNPELPGWFVEVIGRLLEKNPADRFESAKEVSELLERCLAHVHQPTSAPLPWTSKSTSLRRHTMIGAFSRRIRMWIIAVMLIAICAIAYWSPALFTLTPQQSKAVSESNLNRLTAALAAYEQEKGHYPASVIYGKDGQGGPAHSWRVEILPYLGYKVLYDQYRMDEEWNSPHNRTVLARMPDVYRAPPAHRQSTNTSYFGVILEDAKPVLPRKAVQDGTRPASAQVVDTIRIVPRTEGAKIELSSVVTNNSQPPELTTILTNGVRLIVNDDPQAENSHGQVEISADRMMIWSDKFGMFQELMPDQKYQIYLEGNVVIAESSKSTMRADVAIYDMRIRRRSILKIDLIVDDESDLKAFRQRGDDARPAIDFLSKGPIKAIDGKADPATFSVGLEPETAKLQKMTTEEGADPSVAIITMARDQLDMANQKLLLTRELDSKGGISREELSRVQLDVEEARIQLADAEGNKKAVLQALEEIAKLKEEAFERMKKLHENGLMTLAEVNEAEIRYLEAMVHLASAKFDHRGLRQALEKIVTVRARNLEIITQMVNSGQVARIEITKAETDWKLARALFKAVEHSPASTVLQQGLESIYDGDDLNRIHSRGTNLTDVLGNRARCDACHQSAQLESWHRKSLTKPPKSELDPSYRDAVQRGLEYLSKSPRRQNDAVKTDELVARQFAMQQWKDLTRTPFAAGSDGDKQLLIRRIYLDLIGRLPTAREISNHLADDSPAAADHLLEQIWTESLTSTVGTIADGLFVPGGSTLFSRPTGAKPIEIIDGTSGTIAIVECKRDIPWTKPEDLRWDSQQLEQGAALGGWYPDGWFAGMVDGRSRFLDGDSTLQQTRALLTISDGDQIRAERQPSTLMGRASRQNAVIRLNHRNAAEVAKVIGELLKLDSTEESNTRIVTDEASNALLVSAFPDTLETIRGLIQAIDVSSDNVPPKPYHKDIKR